MGEFEPSIGGTSPPHRLIKSSLVGCRKSYVSFLCVFSCFLACVGAVADNLDESLVRTTHHNGLRIDIIPNGGIWFNELREITEGNILGINSSRVARLNSHLQVTDTTTYGWDRSSDRRTWFYSPHFVVAGSEVYFCGKYFEIGNLRDEFVFVSSVHEPSTKVSLDLCQRTRYGWRGGYCGQFDNFATADFLGDGVEHAIISEVDLKEGKGEVGGSKLHILNVGRILETDASGAPFEGIQTLETDPINYSYPLTRNISGSTKQEVLFVSYPSQWTNKSHNAAWFRSGDVRLARLYGDEESGRVQIEYLNKLDVKHKIWHLIESPRFNGIVMARTFKDGKQLELRDLDGNILNRWKLGRDFIGVQRVLVWHEFPIEDCTTDDPATVPSVCYRTVVVLTDDWFSCKSTAALFAGRTDRCPTKVLELHDSGEWEELFSITFEKPKYSVYRGRTSLQDGRAIFSTDEHIYAISLEDQGIN